MYNRPFHRHQFASLSNTNLQSPNGQMPLQYERNGRPEYRERVPSTRNCGISRTPGQRMLFEQTLMDFKLLHPGDVPILIIIPVSSSATVLADMTSQLIQFSKVWGKGRVVVSFGVDKRHDDNINSQIDQTSEALFTSKILHNLRFTEDLDDWTQLTIQGYRHDFEVAVILRGVICAADLVRLVINTIENNADLTCSVDLTFSPGLRVTTSTGNIDIANNTPFPTEDLIRARRFLQARCCDGSVKAISFRGAFAQRFSGEPCRQRSMRSEEFASLEDVIGNQHPEARIMISPSVKSSPDPEDFRSAMQRGYMDLQGYDYRPVVWEE